MRRPPLPGVKLDMTPMIDVVFQLLTFFILTFRIVEAEGDFAVRLPLAAGPSASALDALPPLQIRLVAGPAGELAEVRLSERRLAGLAELHGEVQRLLTDPAVAALSEAQLCCDSGLAYEHCIAAVTAISGDLQPDGTVRPLAAKIRFCEPR